MGEYSLQILEGYVVVLTLMLLPMLGLGNKNANRYNGQSDKDFEKVSRAFQTVVRKHFSLRAGKDILSFLRQKMLAVVPKSTVYI